MPARSTKSHSSNARSRAGQNKAATGSKSSPNMARRGKGSANANRARREKAGTLKIDGAKPPIAADHFVDDHDEFELTEGKLRKQAEQKWALRMNTIAPDSGSGSDSDIDE